MLNTVAHGDDLAHTPLAEAFFELRWQLTSGPAPSTLVDPNYKVLVGSLFERFRASGYPFHEQLETATVPDELVPYLIQHRFRPAEGTYPLVQVGPGVFAVNETTGYSWSTFRPRVDDSVKTLREAYSGELIPVRFTLRYLNAVQFDFDQQDMFDYLRENLKVTVGYPTQLFTEQPVEKRPNTASLQSSHRLATPPGIVMIQFGSAEVFGERKLVWEIQIQSQKDDTPGLDDLPAWLDQAHTVARAWFFTLIEGRLEADFNN